MGDNENANTLPDHNIRHDDEAEDDADDVVGLEAPCLVSKKGQTGIVDCFPGVKERQKTISQCISYMFLFMHVRNWKAFGGFCHYIRRKYPCNKDFSALLAIYKTDRLRMTGRVHEAGLLFPVIERLLRQASDVQCLSVRYLTSKAFVLHDLGRHQEARSVLGQAVQLAALQTDSNPTTYNMTIYAYSGLIHHTDRASTGHTRVPGDHELTMAEQYFERVPEKHIRWLEDLEDEPKVRDQMEQSLVPWTFTDYIFILLRTCPDKGFKHFDTFQFPQENLSKARKCIDKLSTMNLNAKCLVRYHLILCDADLREILCQVDEDTNRLSELVCRAVSHARRVLSTCYDVSLQPYADKCMGFRLRYIRQHYGFLKGVGDLEGDLAVKTLASETEVSEAMPSVCPHRHGELNTQTQEEDHGGEKRSGNNLNTNIDETQAEILESLSSCQTHLKQRHCNIENGHSTNDGSEELDANCCQTHPKGRNMDKKVVCPYDEKDVDTSCQTYPKQAHLVEEQVMRFEDDQHLHQDSSSIILPPLGESAVDHGEFRNPLFPESLSSHQEFLRTVGINPFCQCLACRRSYEEHLADCLECSRQQTQPKTEVSAINDNVLFPVLLLEHTESSP